MNVYDSEPRAWSPDDLDGEYGITVDEAIALLRKRSRDNNLKLADLCSAVVHRSLRINGDG